MSFHRGDDRNGAVQQPAVDERHIRVAQLAFRDADQSLFRSAHAEDFVVSGEHRDLDARIGRNRGENTLQLFHHDARHLVAIFAVLHLDEGDGVIEEPATHHR